MSEKAATKSVKVYALQHPDTKIRVQFVYPNSDRIHFEEAALISFVYNLTAKRRPQPSEEPEKTIYKNLRPWKRVTVPGFVVVTEDGVCASGSPVVAWKGKKSLQGDAPWGRPIVGVVSGQQDGVVFVSVDPEIMQEVMESRRPPAKVEVMVESPKWDTPIIPEVVTPEPEPDEPIFAMGTAVEPNHAEYTGDPFSVRDDGHYVGDDGFLVPANFDEFYDRYPRYVVNWVKKRLNRFTIDDDVEDWTQDLLIHMKFLPEHSKHRQPGANGHVLGCSDVIETFNPYQQYGASERRFRNYINFCLANKFNTVQSKRQKNPVCRPGNIPYGAGFGDLPEAESSNAGSDEFVHQNSQHLVALAERKQKQHDDALFTNQFKRFVKKEDPSVYPAITALEATGPLGEAAEYMGVTEQEFARYRARLKQLGECFLQRQAVPKQRKPYKKRSIATAATAAPAAASKE